MVKQFTSVLYCVIFVLAILLFSTRYTYNEWQYGKSEDQERIDNTFAIQMSVNEPLSTPMEAKRRTKRLILALDFTASILGIIDFVIQYNKPEEIDETKKYFKEIELQLYKHETEINSVLEAIKQMSLVTYSEPEIEIKNGLKTLQQHLVNPMDKEMQTEFYEQAVKLDKHLKSLIDGLLGRKFFNADIMIKLRDLKKVSVNVNHVIL